MMRVLVPIAIAGLLVLSGCLGTSEDTPSEDGSPSPTSGGPGSNQTGEPGSPEPQPPIARISVLDNGTALAPVNGSYPATSGVNLTFNGSASSDADGAIASYAWKLNGTSAGTGAAIVISLEEGMHNVTLTVTDDDGLTASVSVMVNASSAGPAFAFFDGAEEPAAWTFDSKIFFSLNLGMGEERTLDEEHPLAAGWHTTEEAAYAGSKSWTSRDEDAGGYHDHEWVSMTSPAIDLTGAGAATLSFMIKGDGEDNNKDGVYYEVSSDAGETWVELGLKDGLAADWTQITADLADHVGKSIQIRFVFKSDASCSQDTPFPEGCGAGEYLAYYVDDIAVLAA